MMRTMLVKKEATKRDKNFPDQSIATKTQRNEQLKKKHSDSCEVQEGLSKDPSSEIQNDLFLLKYIKEIHVTSVMKILGINQKGKFITYKIKRPTYIK